MKLLFCEECATVFNLARTPRTCDCGKCGGRYLPDGINAEYFGPAVVFGIDNTSFLRARAMQEVLDHEGYSAAGAPFDAFIIPANTPTINKATPMTDEDEQDLKAYDKAMEEHLKNPVVYSQKEVQKRLLPAPAQEPGGKGFFARLFGVGS